MIKKNNAACHLYFLLKTGALCVAPEGYNWNRQLVCVVGSSFTGKTHWLSHLFLKIHSQFHYGVVYSSTDRIAGEYSFMPTENRHDSWEDIRPCADHPKGKSGFRTVLGCILRAQTNNMLKMGRDRCPNVFIIVDDGMGVIDFHHSEEFKTLAGQLRKYNITLFVLTQYVKHLSPALRNGCHRLVIFQNTEEDMMKCKELVIGFRSRVAWLTYVGYATRGFGAVMYDRVSREVTCIRAPPHAARYNMKFG